MSMSSATSLIGSIIATLSPLSRSLSQPVETFGTETYQTNLESACCEVGGVELPDEPDFGGSFCPGQTKNEIGGSIVDDLSLPMIYGDSFKTREGVDMLPNATLCSEKPSIGIPDFRGNWTGSLNDKDYFQRVEQCKNQITITVRMSDGPYFVHQYEHDPEKPRLNFKSFFPTALKNRKKDTTYKENLML